MSSESLTDRISGILHTWTILHCIGEGATAEVYEAVHVDGRRGAVKVLRPELCSMPEALSRFTHEGHVANQVNHPGIVAALDSDTTPDGRPFIVMELLEGETLDEKLEREGTLGQAETCRLGIKLLDVLEAVHDQAILHRDLKPDNLFLTEDGCLKLIDFGIARDAERTGVQTRLGVAMGTPGYMPVEQAAGDWENVDVRTDLWAAGAVLFRALAGECVHLENTVTEVLCAAMTRGASPVADKRAGIAPKLAAVVDKALCTHATDRFQSAREMREALELALEEVLTRRQLSGPQPGGPSGSIRKPVLEPLPALPMRRTGPLGMAVVFALGVAIPLAIFVGVRIHGAQAESMTVEPASSASVHEAPSKAEARRDP